MFVVRSNRRRVEIWAGEHWGNSPMPRIVGSCVGPRRALTAAATHQVVFWLALEHLGISQLPSGAPGPRRVRQPATHSQLRNFRTWAERALFRPSGGQIDHLTAMVCLAVPCGSQVGQWPIWPLLAPSWREVGKLPTWPERVFVCVATWGISPPDQDDVRPQPFKARNDSNHSKRAFACIFAGPTKRGSSCLPWNHHAT